MYVEDYHYTYIKVFHFPASKRWISEDYRINLTIGNTSLDMIINIDRLCNSALEAIM